MPPSLSLFSGHMKDEGVLGPSLQKLQSRGNASRVKRKLYFHQIFLLKDLRNHHKIRVTLK